MGCGSSKSFKKKNLNTKKQFTNQIQKTPQIIKVVANEDNIAQNISKIVKRQMEQNAEKNKNEYLQQKIPYQFQEKEVKEARKQIRRNRFQSLMEITGSTIIERRRARSKQITEEKNQINSSNNINNQGDSPKSTANPHSSCRDHNSFHDRRKVRMHSQFFIRQRNQSSRKNSLNFDSNLPCVQQYEVLRNKRNSRGSSDGSQKKLRFNSIDYKTNKKEKISISISQYQDMIEQNREKYNSSSIIEQQSLINQILNKKQNHNIQESDKYEGIITNKNGIFSDLKHEEYDDDEEHEEENIEEFSIILEQDNSQKQKKNLEFEGNNQLRNKNQLQKYKKKVKIENYNKSQHKIESQ